MYRYTESGLKNVWLVNGYRQRGDAVAIEDSEGLHKAIGRTLARKPRLSGPELRYLRKELGFSQIVLGGLLKVSEETVSLWERKGRVPHAAARIVQALYLEVVDGDVKLRELVETLAQLDNKQTERMIFRETQEFGWFEAPEQLAAA